MLAFDCDESFGWNPFGSGSKINRRGQPQVLVPRFPLTRASHVGTAFEPQPFGRFLLKLHVLN